MSKIRPEDHYGKVWWAHWPTRAVDNLDVSFSAKWLLVCLCRNLPPKPVPTRFKKDRLKGEWFTASPELLDFIGELSE